MVPKWFISQQEINPFSQNYFQIRYSGDDEPIFVVKQTAYIHICPKSDLIDCTSTLKKSHPFVDVFNDHSWLYSHFQWWSAIQVEKEMLGC